MKKIFALLLTLCMVIGLLPTAASAAEASKWDGTTEDISWYNNTDKKFTIDTAAELAGLAQLVNNGTETFAGKRIYLANDIDLDGREWTPIGLSKTHAFRGNFYGQNHTVSNLKISNGEYAGLFGYLWNNASGEYDDTDGYHYHGYLGGIEDLTINNVNITGATNAGAFLGGGVYTSGNTAQGGVIQMNNLTLTGDVVIEGTNAGGIIGTGWLDVRVDAVNVKINANVGSYVKGTDCAGGVFGSAPHGNEMVNITSNIDVIGGGIVGGIAGKAGWYWDDITCTGTITATGESVKAGTIFGVIADNAWWPNSFSTNYCNMTDLNGSGATLTINGEASTQLFDPVGIWNAEFVYEANGRVYEKSALVSIDDGEGGLMTWPAAMKAVEGKAATVTLTLVNDSTRAFESDIVIPTDANVTIDLGSNKLVANIINNGETGNLTIKGTSTVNEITLEDPIKEGKVFAGWYTDKNYQNKLDNATITTVDATGTTYYAKWVDSKITYDANGGSDTVDIQYANKGDTLKANEFTYEGHTFAGWCTEDGTIYSAGAEIGDELKGEHTLYAVWSVEIDGVKYTVNPAAPSQTYNGIALTPEIHVTKNGETEVESTDYTVEYPDDMTNAGPKEIKIKVGENEIGVVHFVIEKAELTATYVSETITVGGTPALTVEVTGFVNGENESVLTKKPSIDGTVPTEVGEHTLTPFGGEDDNYEFKYVSGTLTIKEKEEETKPDPKPDPCDHSFDANGKCKYCGIIVIDHTTEKADDESNPNTGAPVIAPVVLIALAAVAFGKKK